MDPSPSHARRMALRESDQVRMTVSNKFPIDKYYEVTDRLYAALSLAVEDRRLDDAYVLGIRFATFSVDILPKHTSYKRQQQTLRRRNAARVERVLQIVESVVERMDAEEIVKMQQEKQRQEEENRKKAQLEEEEKMKKQQQKEDEKRREEDEKRRKVDETKKALERSALAKLAAMTRKDREQQTNQQANTARKKQEVAKNRNDGHAEVTKKCEERKRSALEQIHAAEPAEKPTFQPPRSNHHSERPLGLRRDEERTIDLLQETIARQEDRIEDITEVKIPALLRKAKTKLAAGQRKEAIYCVYLKRKWDRNVELLKAGIFKMETHILRLEAAAEDREVAKVMKAATDAMQTIQVDVGIAEVDDMNRVMAEMAQCVQNDDLLFDEEELLSDLMEEDSATSQISDQGVSMLPGSQDLLTLPSAPSDELPDAKKPSLLKPVVS